VSASQDKDHIGWVIAEVRELAHGILPAVLTHGGLRAGIDALGSRNPVPVEINASVDRLAARVDRPPTSSWPRR
jgi:signal transduction histidine kinase